MKLTSPLIFLWHFLDIGADNVNASIFFMHGGENCNIVLNCVEDGTSNFTGTITETKLQIQLVKLRRLINFLIY